MGRVCGAREVLIMRRATRKPGARAPVGRGAKAISFANGFGSHAGRRAGFLRGAGSPVRIAELCLRMRRVSLVRDLLRSINCF